MGTQGPLWAESGNQLPDRTGRSTAAAFADKAAIARRVVRHRKRLCSQVAWAHYRTSPDLEKSLKPRKSREYSLVHAICIKVASASIKGCSQRPSFSGRRSISSPWSRAPAKDLQRQETTTLPKPEFDIPETRQVA